MPDAVAANGPHTPNFDDSAIKPSSTRYLDVDGLPWMDTFYDGIKMKILFKDEQRGVMTALFRWQPGAKLPMHEHTDVEQSYVLEGSLCDFEGECKAGDYAWRPAGSKHDAWSPKGCLLLAILLEPNKFLEGPEAS
jgi:anti-sigma factor ChrR (cupin superfamily)